MEKELEQIWVKKLGDTKWTSHAFRTLANDKDISNEFLCKQLASLIYVEVTSGFAIDACLLAEWAEEECKRKDFIKEFVRYIMNNKPYFIQDFKEHLAKRDWTKKWITYCR